MRAVSGAVPPDDEGWAYEIKWDGVRAIGFVEDGRLRLQSANGIDITDRYPELAPIADELGGHAAILDGEIVRFNDAGRPDFGLLQSRMHRTDAATVARAAAEHPVVWVLFDLLHLDGHDLATGLGPTPAPGAPAAVPVPYEDRRRLLEALIEPGPNWQVPAALHGTGAELLAVVADRGMEGLIAKRRGSAYEAGRRSPTWRKLKVRRRQEFVVGGWKEGAGGRRSTVGALLVGYHTDDGRLAYAGRVGSGITDVELRHLQATLDATACDACPFDPPPTRDEMRGARWVEPQLVVEVAFGEWSADQRLRHPSYLGTRTDKDPGTVVREPG
jgi:bifunctional non-homologous end joining protein LigD